jgi:pimeloyl-[acyl-carrier protein] methyl ester esterase
MITQIRQALSNRTTTLHASTTGRGPTIVLLHGWGLHSAVWNRVLPSLSEVYRIIRIDLPGHGLSDQSVDLSDLEILTAALRKHIHSPARILGWSLGGLIALAYALRYPSATQRLVLVASTPRFVSASDWQHAAAPEVFEDFSLTLERDYRATLNRFLALQVRSSEAARSTLRDLREILLERPPQCSALRAGLALLRGTDLRDHLQYLECPTRLIMGEKDTLVPKNCAQETVRRLKDGAFHIIPGAGHAPFLSHPDEFTATLHKFLKD